MSAADRIDPAAIAGELPGGIRGRLGQMLRAGAERLEVFGGAPRPLMPRTTRLQAPAQLTVGVRGAFRQRIREAVSGGATLVVVDLGGSSYVDSSGIGMLLAEKRRLNAGGGVDLVLAGVPADLVEMFRLTRLDRAFAPVDGVAPVELPGDISLPGDGA